jgi:hypothetical protein
VWNVWRQTGRIEALNQLRQFLKEMTDLAHETGSNLGKFRENVLYMGEYDRLIAAFGGQRAVSQMMAVPA